MITLPTPSRRHWVSGFAWAMSLVTVVLFSFVAWVLPTVPLSAGGATQGSLYLPGTEFLSYGLTFGVRRIR